MFTFWDSFYFISFVEAINGHPLHWLHIWDNKSFHLFPFTFSNLRPFHQSSSPFSCFRHFPFHFPSTSLSTFEFFTPSHMIAAYFSPQYIHIFWELKYIYSKALFFSVVASISPLFHPPLHSPFLPLFPLQSPAVTAPSLYVTGRASKTGAQNSRGASPLRMRKKRQIRERRKGSARGDQGNVWADRWMLYYSTGYSRLAVQETKGVWQKKI